MLFTSEESTLNTKEFLSHANDLFILHQFCQFTYKEYSSLDDRRQRNSQWCGVVPISPSYKSECVSICVCGSAFSGYGAAEQHRLSSAACWQGVALSVTTPLLLHLRVLRSDLPKQVASSPFSNGVG